MAECNNKLRAAHKQQKKLTNNQHHPGFPLFACSPLCDEPGPARPGLISSALISHRWRGQRGQCHWWHRLVLSGKLAGQTKRVMIYGSHRRGTSAQLARAWDPYSSCGGGGGGGGDGIGSTWVAQLQTTTKTNYTHTHTHKLLHLCAQLQAISAGQPDNNRPRSNSISNSPLRVCVQYWLLCSTPLAAPHSLTDPSLWWPVPFGSDWIDAINFKLWR